MMRTQKSLRGLLKPYYLRYDYKAWYGYGQHEAGMRRVYGRAAWFALLNPATTCTELAAEFL